MARIPMVTRTMNTTNCVVAVLNKETKEVEKIDFTLSRQYKTEEEMLKAVKKSNTDENINPLYIESFTLESALYGMEETEFLKVAKRLS